MSDFAICARPKGKTVFLIGDGSGTGAESVLAFASQGAKVGFVDKNETSGQALLSALEGDHPFATSDFRDISGLQSVFAERADELGFAEVFVNNAVRDDWHDWREVTPEHWDEWMQTNLRHMVLAIRSVARDMIGVSGGTINNIGVNSWWECDRGPQLMTRPSQPFMG